MSKIKTLIFYFLLLFPLLYFEDIINIGGVTLSNLWKTIVIFAFLFYCFDKILRNRKIDSLNKTIFLFCFSLLYGVNKFNFSQFQEVITILILPIAYYSFYFIYSKKIVKLKNKLLDLSIYLILFSVPFILKIVEPLKSNIVEAEIYGLKDGVLVGLFKHPSLSSKVFVFASLYLYVYITQNQFNKLVKFFLYGVFVVGLYSIYMSFTRTGWAMMLFGVLFTTLYKKKIKTYIFKAIPVLIIVSYGLFYFYNTNESFQRRINGDRIGRENSQIDQTTLLTSGRDILILNAIESVKQSGISGILFGLGKDVAIKKNNNTLAHNRFVEIYQYGGLISLFIFLYYLFLLYKEFSKRKTDSIYYRLSLLYFLLMLVSLIPSHGLPLWADVLMGGVIAVNRIEFEKKYKK